MKKLVAILFVLFASGNLCAANDDNSNLYIRQKASELEVAINDPKNSKWKDDADSSDFIKRTQKFGQHTQSMLKRLYFVEKTKNEIWDEFLRRLEEKSKQTGREIKQDKDGCKLTVWLDRGEFDSDYCKQVYQTPETCFYPDDFEEWMGEYSDCGDDYSWVVHMMLVMDDKNKDTETVWNSFIQYDGNKKDKSFQGSIGGWEQAYKVYQQWRQQEVKDLRAGKMKMDSDGLLSLDTSRWWESQRIPTRGTQVFQYLVDVFSSDEDSFTQE